MKKEETKTIVHYRDAKTGGYVSKRYAEANPKTTVKETDKMLISKK